MKKVIIIVPIYNSSFSAVEKISVKQLLRVMNAYEICFIAPESLISQYPRECVGYQMEFFDDNYFRSTASYSALMMESFLYDYFNEYEYMLLYQTDAFVFSDRIGEFISESYDIIGAPVARAFWPELNIRIGNGGFCLRKIDTVRRFLEEKDKYLESWKIEHPDDTPISIELYEDKFFAYCMEKNTEDIKLPSVERALQFSMDYNINSCFYDKNRSLPFGCHRWYKYRFDYWWNRISEYGYSLSSDNIKYYMKSDETYEKRILYYYLEHEELNRTEREKLKKTISTNGMASIWGYGKYGHMIENVFKILGVKINKIFDNNSDRENVLFPVKETLEFDMDPIVICMKNGGQQIKKEIERWELKRECILLDDLEKRWISALCIDMNGAIVDDDL